MPRPDPSKPLVRIAIVGDFRPDHEHHPATAASIGHAAERHQRPVEATWVPTPEVDGRAAEVLVGFDAIWIAPGSPYASMQGALDAITYGRLNRIPLLGTCAGFQHIVIEVGRNLCGLRDATHAESEPDAPELMITPLACSLAGRTFTVHLTPGSASAVAYAAEEADERYYCSFGLNPDYLDVLADAGLVVTGTDHDGEPRIVELAARDRFLVGTLFVPQMRSEPGEPHPLVAAFVDAAIAHADDHAGTGQAITR